MNITNLDEFKDFMTENIIDKNKAAEVTGQSIRAFDQSVLTGKVKPFFEIENGSRSIVKLYLKSDIEDYKKNMRQVNR